MSAQENYTTHKITVLKFGNDSGLDDVEEVEQLAPLYKRVYNTTTKTEDIQIRPSAPDFQLLQIKE